MRLYLTKLKGAALAAPFSLGLVGICTVLFAWLGFAPDGLLMEQGNREAHRWITAHLVHSDVAHLVWNLGGLCVLGLVFEPLLKWRLPLVLAVAATAVAIWFETAQQSFTLYCGLSSLLNALLGAGLLLWWVKQRDRLALWMAAGAVMKIAIEYQYGGTLLPTGSWQSTPVAHLLGMFAGAGVIGLLELSRRLGMTERRQSTFTRERVCVENKP